jgi:hypothetical protein
MSGCLHALFKVLPDTASAGLGILEIPGSESQMLARATAITWENSEHESRTPPAKS